MTDHSPIVVAVLAFFGVLLVGGGLFGRMDWSKPRCRACGCDVRPFVWDSPSACACGRLLERRGAARPTCRRYPRCAAVGIGLIACAAVLGWMATGVRARAIGWIDELPAWAFAWAIREGACNDELALASVRRRLDDDPGVAPALRDALLARLAGAADATIAEEWDALALALPLAPDVEPEALGAALRRSFVNTWNEEGEIEVGRFVAGPQFPFLVARVDDVRIGGAGVSWSDRTSQPVSNDPPEPWHGTWLGAGRRIQVPSARASDDGARDSLEVHLTVAMPHAMHPAITQDVLVRSTPDAALWGVDWIEAPIVARGAQRAFSSPEYARRRAVDRSKPCGCDRRGSKPEPASRASASIASAALLAFAMALGPVLFLVAARSVAARLRRLTPPRCRKCRSILNARTSVPERCSECGTPTDRMVGAACIDRGGRVRRFIGRTCAILAAGAIAFATWMALTPIDATPLARWLRSDERHLAWLVRRVADGDFGDVGPQAFTELGEVQTLEQRWSSGTITTADRRDTAFQALHAWARDPSGGIAPTEDDPTGLARRIHLRRFLTTIVRGPEYGNWMPPSTHGRYAPVESELAVVNRALALVAPLELAPLVRAGDGEHHDVLVDLDPPREARVVLGLRLMPESRPGERARCMRTSMAVVHAMVERSDVPVDDPPILSAPFEMAWLPLGQHVMPRDLCTASLARRARVSASMIEAGARDLVVLEPPPLWQGVLWLGRWEVSIGHAPPLATLREPFRGGSLSALVSAPPSGVDTLHVRFVPDDVDLSSQAVASGAYAAWSRPTTFRLERVRDAGSGRCPIHYRVVDASVE